jgi:hypothetical protein
VGVHASHEALTLHSPVAHPGSPWLTLLAKRECLKQHGVGERKGELGADFSSIVLPRVPMLTETGFLRFGLRLFSLSLIKKRYLREQTKGNLSAKSVFSYLKAQLLLLRPAFPL